MLLPVVFVRSLIVLSFLFFSLSSFFFVLCVQCCFVLCSVLSFSFSAFVCSVRNKLSDLLFPTVSLPPALLLVSFVSFEEKLVSISLDVGLVHLSLVSFCSFFCPLSLSLLLPFLMGSEKENR